MPQNRSGRLVFALIVFVLLLVIGRNFYRHSQENLLDEAVGNGDDKAAADLLKGGAYANNPRKLEYLLCEAAMRNEPNTVRALLQSGVNPNTTAVFGSPPLVIAAQHCPDVVGLLLDKGAEVNARESMSGTALTAAINSKRTDTARLLVDRGADVNLIDFYDTPPLTLAVRQGDKEVVSLLLERGASVDKSTIGAAQQEENALQEAVVQGNKEILLLLLAAKPNQTIRSKALIMAVTKGNADMVRALLAAGARPTPQSQEWLKAVYAARQQSQAGKAGYGEVLALLRPLGVTTTVTKTEIEARNAEGQTALLAALAKNDAEEARNLLAQGANVNAQDRQGRTPLMEAIRHHSPLSSSLLDKGANPNTFATAGSSAGITPLQQAVQANDIALVRLLLAHGANPNLQSPHQTNLLARARKHHQAEIVTLLQNAGAKE